MSVCVFCIFVSVSICREVWIDSSEITPPCKLYFPLYGIYCERVGVCCHVRARYACLYLLSAARLQSRCGVLRCRRSPQRFLFSPSIPQHEASGERREEEGGCFINNLTCDTEICPPTEFCLGKSWFLPVHDSEGEPGLTERQTDKEERKGGRGESREFFNFLHKTGWLQQHRRSERKVWVLEEEQGERLGSGPVRLKWKDVELLLPYIKICDCWMCHYCGSGFRLYTRCWSLTVSISELEDFLSFTEGKVLPKSKIYIFLVLSRLFWFGRYRL